MSENHDTPALGRLTSFGINEGWQALLLAPTRHEPLSPVIRDSASLFSPTDADLTTEIGGIERRAVIVGHVLSPAEYDPIKKRTNLRVRLSDGETVRVMAFGHPNQLPGDWRRKGSQASMLGKLLLGENGFALLVGPTPIPDALIGHAMGVYPGKTRVIKPETVRDRVLSLINADTLHQAAGAIAKGVTPYRIEDVLGAWSQARGYGLLTAAALPRAIHRMHMPVSVTQGQAAKTLLSDLSALALLLQAERERPKSEDHQSLHIAPASLDGRIKRISHTPTQEQLAAVTEALADMASGQPMHRLLSGDVGTGKTTVFALLAAAVYDAGGEVGIMLPSEDMVQQVIREIGSWWPDIEISQITGASKERTRHRLRIGTTAMISESEADWRPTLMIVDEQQKYSAHQRQALTQHGGHLMEATATCLPRTMAQLQFGLIPVSRLTRSHTPKQISTELWDSAQADQRKTLFQEVKATLDENAQVLVIYAARDKVETGAGGSDMPHDLLNEQIVITPLEEGAERWRRVLGDHEVAVLHGRMKPAEREENLARIRSGEARVLCATTAAEVGLNLPRLRHAVINNPERFGLVTLHQIRGRLARNGGWGRCDLLGDLERLPEGAAARLEAFTKEQDGFALAELDMRQRGMGSLLTSEARQSGDADTGLLIGERPGFENFEVANQVLEQLAVKSPTAPTVGQYRQPDLEGGYDNLKR